MNMNLKLSTPDHNTEELQKAFDVFNQVSQELTQAYGSLQARVESLTEELAIANGKLRRQFEEKEALSERLSLLLNALPAGVVVLDDKNSISVANPAALLMLKEANEESEWQTLADAHIKPTDAPDEWQIGEHLVSISESALDSAGGKILLLHDITAAHHLKNEVERSGRLAAMGEMAASLAHQLRTPLATALLYSANLMQETISDEARTRFAEKANAQLKRLERLIQDVLLFARGESIGRDKISCIEFLEEACQTVRPLCAEKNIQFSAPVLETDIEIIGSKKALSGALLNLLENALHAFEDTEKAHPKVSLQVKISDGLLEIIIKDNGKGMASDTKTRIFEPFFTTRGQGTGLGLAIALGVCRAHGGNIVVKSAAGKGAEFTLSLPILRAGLEETKIRLEND